MAHTPGPWKVITQAAAREVDVFEVAEISHFRVIPDRPDTWSTCGDAHSDARLIAAAPDLVLQLLAAANYIDALGGDSKTYRAAIAKATGKQ